MAGFLVSLAAASVVPEFLAGAGFLQAIPELVSEARAGSDAESYVFLQRFPVTPTGVMKHFYHTEVVVCPKSEFSATDQQYLDEEIKGMKRFAQVEDSWWSQRASVKCVRLGYGGAGCEDACCGVRHSGDYSLSSHTAMVYADTSKKAMFIYGTGTFDGYEAYHRVCASAFGSHKCWSDWAGADYSVLTLNCNTFTSTVLYSVYGLSQKKPRLGFSDMVTVRGHCPTEMTELLV